MSDHRYFPAIRQLAKYETWCNEQLLSACASLEPSRLFQAFPFGWGTIHRTLFHTVNVFRTWSACVGPQIAKPPPLSYDATLPLEAIGSLNAELSAHFLAALDASHAAGLLHADRRTVQVFHLVTHGTHHRTQVISMLRMLGIDPPYEPGDFAGWTRSR